MPSLSDAVYAAILEHLFLDSLLAKLNFLDDLLEWAPKIKQKDYTSEVDMYLLLYNQLVWRKKSPQLLTV